MDGAAARIEPRLAFVLPLLQQRTDLARDVVHQARHSSSIGRIGVCWVGGWGEGAAGMLAAVGVEWGVTRTEARGGVVDGELHQWDELGPVILPLIDEGAKDILHNSVESLHLCRCVVMVRGPEDE